MNTIEYQICDTEVDDKSICSKRRRKVPPLPLLPSAMAMICGYAPVSWLL